MPEEQTGRFPSPHGFVSAAHAPARDEAEQPEARKQHRVRRGLGNGDYRDAPDEIVVVRPVEGTAVCRERAGAEEQVLCAEVEAPGQQPENRAFVGAEGGVREDRPAGERRRGRARPVEGARLVAVRSAGVERRYPEAAPQLPRGEGQADDLGPVLVRELVPVAVAGGVRGAAAFALGAVPQAVVVRVVAEPEIALVLAPYAARDDESVDRDSVKNRRIVLRAVEGRDAAESREIDGRALGAGCLNRPERGRDGRQDGFSHGRARLSDPL